MPCFNCAPMMLIKTIATLFTLSFFKIIVVCHWTNRSAPDGVNSKDLHLLHDQD